MSYKNIDFTYINNKSQEKNKYIQIFFFFCERERSATNYIEIFYKTKCMLVLLTT
jgi:hypothetical protein